MLSLLQDFVGSMHTITTSREHGQWYYVLERITVSYPGQTFVSAFVNFSVIQFVLNYHWIYLDIIQVNLRAFEVSKKFPFS